MMCATESSREKTFEETLEQEIIEYPTAVIYPFSPTVDKKIHQRSRLHFIQY